MCVCCVGRRRRCERARTPRVAPGFRCARRSARTERTGDVGSRFAMTECTVDVTHRRLNHVCSSKRAPTARRASDKSSQTSTRAPVRCVASRLRACARALHTCRSHHCACVAIVDMLRTTLGPRGMDKLVYKGRTQTISNDGATIMRLLDVVHPAAKTLVQIARSQDEEVRERVCVCVFVFVCVYVLLSLSFHSIISCTVCRLVMEPHRLSLSPVN